jgi:hypothetical protein
MSLDATQVQLLFDLIQSKALATGDFDSVNTAEPKSSPGNDVTCAIWLDTVKPIRSSGLNATSLLLTFNARIYTNMLQDPQDAIDPNMMTAACDLMLAYSEDFELIDPQRSKAVVREIDLLGEFGNGLMAQAGYVNIGGQMNRVITVTVPVVFNDAFTQGD